MIRPLICPLGSGTRDPSHCSHTMWQCGIGPHKCPAKQGRI